MIRRRSSTRRISRFQMSRRTYYGIRPTRTDDALKAWTNALSIAHDEIEREGVYLHFGRLKMAAGRFAEARGTSTP